VSGPWRCGSVVLVLALAAGAAGCANGRVSEQDDVRGVVRTFLDQCAANRPLHVLPELLDPAQRLVVDAGSPRRGCARVLDLPAAATVSSEELRGAALELVDFDGARARVDVTVGPYRPTLRLSRGTDRWRIEAP
jgi:hypothetical protein